MQLQTNYTAFTFPDNAYVGNVPSLNSEDNDRPSPPPFGFCEAYFGPILPPEMEPDSRIRFTELTSTVDESIHEPSEGADPQPAPVNTSENITEMDVLTETKKQR